MWSDRKQPEDSPRTTPTPVKPEAPVSGSPVGTPELKVAANAPGVAIVGKGMVIKGQIRSGEHVHVAGEVDGSLYLAGYDLTVAADSKVHADVTAREVDNSGSIQGNVDATRKITVRKGGQLIGDLRTPGIVIEDGAYFKGNIEIVTREVRRNAEEPVAEVARSTNA